SGVAGCRHTVHVDEVFFSNASERTLYISGSYVTSMLISCCSDTSGVHIETDNQRFALTLVVEEMFDSFWNSSSNPRTDLHPAVILTNDSVAEHVCYEFVAGMVDMPSVGRSKPKDGVKHSCPAA